MGGGGRGRGLGGLAAPTPDASLTWNTLGLATAASRGSRFCYSGKLCPCPQGEPGHRQQAWMTDHGGHPGRGWQHERSLAFRRKKSNAF